MSYRPRTRAQAPALVSPMENSPRSPRRLFPRGRVSSTGVPLEPPHMATVTSLRSVASGDDEDVPSSVAVDSASRQLLREEQEANLRRRRSMVLNQPLRRSSRRLTLGHGKHTDVVQHFGTIYGKGSFTPNRPYNLLPAARPEIPFMNFYIGLSIFAGSVFMAFCHLSLYAALAGLTAFDILPECNMFLLVLICDYAFVFTKIIRIFQGLFKLPTSFVDNDGAFNWLDLIITNMEHEQFAQCLGALYFLGAAYASTFAFFPEVGNRAVVLLFNFLWLSVLDQILSFVDAVLARHSRRYRRYAMSIFAAVTWLLMLVSFGVMMWTNLAWAASLHGQWTAPGYDKSAGYKSNGCDGAVDKLQILVHPTTINGRAAMVTYAGTDCNFIEPAVTTSRVDGRVTLASTSYVQGSGQPPMPLLTGEPFTFHVTDEEVPGSLSDTDFATTT